MKTLIEILDYEQTENIISPLVFDFDKIVYLYDAAHDDKRKRRNLSELLYKKNVTDIEFCCVKNNADEVLCNLTEKYPDAVFNLSNGSRSLLVKMAQFCERTHQRCYTLNFQRKTFSNLNGCDDLKEKFKVPHLNVENIIELSSGEILKTSHALPEMNEKLKLQMMKIIRIMNTDSNAWTKLLGLFAKQLKDVKDEAEFAIEMPQDRAQRKLLAALEDAGILALMQKDSQIRVTFENRTLMRMFSDSGAWLEYQSYLECLDSGLYDDVRISTVVDWNKDSDDKCDPTCEIDLIVIKNCIPVFVSCKMNKCTALDLYEIKLLAEKLGGSLGRAAVISKAYALQKGQPLYLKAQELDILLIGENEIESGSIAQALLKAF